MDFPIEFRDGAGTIRGRAKTKDNWLYVVLGGVQFDGMSLDSLVARPSGQPGLSRFTMEGGCLCECQLIAEIPIRVLIKEEETLGILVAAMTIGSYDISTWEDPEFVLALAIRMDGTDYRTRGDSDSFDHELLQLQASLPETYHMTTCFFCQYSDYHPLGEHESSGSLACFRDVPDQYLGVQSTEDLVRIWEERSGFVQETDLCNAFQIRKAGHGCRSFEP